MSAWRAQYTNTTSLVAHGSAWYRNCRHDKHSKVLNLHFDTDLEHITPVFSLDKVITIYHKKVWLEMCECNLVDVETVLIWLLEPSLWQWPWRQWINPFEGHCFMTMPHCTKFGCNRFRLHHPDKQSFCTKFGCNRFRLHHPDKQSLKLWTVAVTLTCCDFDL